MTTHPKTLEFDTTRLDLAIPFQRRCPMALPTFAIGGCSWPFPVHSLPTDCSFFCAETRLTELAPSVAVGFTAVKQASKDFCLVILAIGIAHGRKPHF